MHPILVVEDMPVVSELLQIVLHDCGCSIVGPCSTVDEARKAVEDRQSLSGAVLDVNLKDGHIFPVAETLLRNGVPVIFLTAYNRSILPPMFENCMVMEKPFTITDLTEAIQRLFKN